MDASQLAAELHPGAKIREISAGANRVFRVVSPDGESIICKVYPMASRERRERRALEALAGIVGVPQMLGHGTSDDTAWLNMSDGGNWNLSNLPKNLDVCTEAGQLLRRVHEANAEITNLSAGIDSDYVSSHYRSTIDRLGRFRRRFGVDQAVLEEALAREPPVAGDPRPSHTRCWPTKFVCDEKGGVTLVDWEWATLGPTEWDLSLALWRIGSHLGEDAAAAFRIGYGSDLPDAWLRPWVAYHAAMMMLEAAEQREGRLGNLDWLVNDLRSAVTGS